MLFRFTKYVIWQEKWAVLLKRFRFQTKLESTLCNLNASTKLLGTLPCPKMQDYPHTPIKVTDMFNEYAFMFAKWFIESIYGSIETNELVINLCH